ncbi:MAG TPA: O-antigen ligase family protein [Chloroflexota bacterium]|nr:O-antigen ligase family protein [Chloroflexota bacterium]
MPIPHRVSQLVTQGALLMAVVLALSINPRMRIRPNWFLGLYTLLAISSLMMSVRLVGLGTAYRSFRMIEFLFVLWLLTPWWGRRDLLLLRNQMRFLLLVLGLVALGLFISPGKELGGRLSGIIWPIPPTQVAHFAAEVAGVMTVLWLCRLVSRSRALMVAVPAMIVLVLTHTRTALLAMFVGLLVAGASLLLARQRVRRTFAAVLLVVVVIGVPASPLLTHWLARGQNGQELQNLTGRTNAWSAVLSTNRPTTNLLFGNGLSNESVTASSNLEENGLPIDSSWISIYQDQGIVGEVLVGAIFMLLLLTALCQARGPTRALALFLIVYCLIAGISESGLGGASPYLLDLAVAASLVTYPSATGTDLAFGLKLPEHPRSVEIER